MGEVAEYVDSTASVEVSRLEHPHVVASEVREWHSLFGVLLGAALVEVKRLELRNVVLFFSSSVLAPPRGRTPVARSPCNTGCAHGPSELPQRLLNKNVVKQSLVNVINAPPLFTGSNRPILVEIVWWTSVKRAAHSKAI